MINGEILAYLCARMNIDARLAMRLLGNDSRYHRDLHFLQHVSHPIVEHCLNDGIAEDDLGRRCRSGIVVEDGLNIREQQALHLWQLVDKLLSQFGRPLLIGLTLRAMMELQSQSNLMAEHIVETFHIHANMIRPQLFVALPPVEIAREHKLAH